VPLEGLEHVLSILHSCIQRRLPRNYAEVGDTDDIERRPKTASWKQDAGKKRAEVASPGATLSRMPETDAGKTLLIIH
jgi:hypothetical protein